MSNFRNTSDLVDGVLRRCGEITSDQGVSPRTNQALLYLNQIHHNIISGGSELSVDCSENWAWAKARRPIVIQINPAITAGTCSLAYGSVSGTFSQAPQLNGSNVSVEGWYLQPTSGPEVYKIVNHTSGVTSFSIDAPFPQSTNSSLSFYLYQLDYDLISTNITVDSENDTLDFIESGTTVLTATIAHGSFTPTGLANAVASALNTAGTHGNSYSCSYDSLQRLFTVSSNLGGTGTPIFQPQGASTNYYRSGWNVLVFDYLNKTGTGSYTGLYPLSSVIRLTQQTRIYYGNTLFNGYDRGHVNYVDPVRFERDFPTVGIKVGVPDSFTIVREKSDGTFTVRFNRYVWQTTNTQAMRVEFEVTEGPKDLQNNTSSIPLVPRKYISILEYGASYYLLNDKSDAKAQVYLGIAQEKFKSMIAENRRELEKAGSDFGGVIARPDLMPRKRRNRVNNYGYDQYE